MAQRLEVAPNALYGHVPSKTAFIDDLLADVQAPAPGNEDATVRAQAGPVLLRDNWRVDDRRQVQLAPRGISVRTR